MKIDIVQLKQAASNRWPEILSTIGGIPAELLDGGHHPCPRCGGVDRFRAFNDGTGGMLCNQCFTVGNSDGVGSIMWLSGVDFKEAAARISEHLSIDVAIHETNGKAARKKKNDPAKDLKFQPWSSALVAHYLAKKPGVTESSLLAAGAKLAKYKSSLTVIAFPIVGENLNIERPVGWAVVNCVGNSVPTWDKEGNITGQKKIKVLYGSKAGLFGVHAIERLKTEGLPELVWKVEGLTDMLALQAAIPEGKQDRHLVVSNSCGTNEKPKWQAEVLARNHTIVLHDADKPGQAGAKRWAKSIAARQADGLDTLLVRLPYEVTESKGKDLRDWLSEGHSYNDLLELAKKTKPVEAGEVDEDGGEPDEDPGLVKTLSDLICEDNWFARDAGGRLYRYRDGAYRSKAEEFIQRKVKNACILLRETKKWSVRLSKEVVAFIGVDAPYWWERPPFGVLNVSNGLVQLSNGALLDHSPEHLSPVQLPVKYDPKATCPELEKIRQ